MERRRGWPLPREDAVARSEGRADEALAAAARGWRVVPVAAGDKRPHPALGSWTSQATTDPSTILSWWTRWPDAGVALATGAASGVVVLDVDGTRGEDALAKLEREHGSLPPTVECLTGGGGRHIYLRHPGGYLSNRSGGAFGTGLDFRGDGGIAILPPTVHASGNLYVWNVGFHPDETAVADLPPWLLEHIKGNASSPPSEVGTRPTRNLPPLWKNAAHLLRHGGPREKRSESLLSVANNAVKLGWTANDLYSAFMAEENVAGTKVRETFSRRDPEAAYSLVATVYAKAVQGMRDSPVGAEIAELRAAVEGTAWPGHAGASEYAILMALVAVMSVARQNPFSASQRQLAELAGVTKKTAQRAIRRLQGLGWLRIIGVDKSCVYLLQTPGAVLTPLSSLSTHVDNGVATAPSHDVWRHRGLGKHSEHLYRRLTELGHGAPVSQLADLLHRRERGVRETLSKLENVGLVERSGTRPPVWRAIERDLGEVAGEVGTYGVGVKQRQLHTAERQRFVSALYGATVELETGEIVLA